MLKVAIIGYGSMGARHSECYKVIDDAEIVAIADTNSEKREKAQSQLGCEVYENIHEMLASVKVDIIDVCTPTHLHEEHVIAAVKAAKGVLCEKPMSLTVESCDNMINAAEESNSTLMIAQVIRFWPEYQVVKEIIDSGEYGNVLWLSASRLGALPQGWFRDSNKSGSAALDLQIHDQDYISYLIGLPKQVSARGVITKDGGVSSIFTTGSGHKSGATSITTASFDMSPTAGFSMTLLVCCEKATIKFDSQAKPSLMVYPSEAEPFAPNIPDPGVGNSTETLGNISALGGYYNEIKYFIDCINTNQKPQIVTPQQSKESVRVCTASIESAKAGNTVNI